MEFYDLKSLYRPTVFDLYDLFEPTYQPLYSIPTSQISLERDHEMRIDLISYDIFGNTDGCDFICNYNDIINPLNVKEGDIISYVDGGAISTFQRAVEVPTTITTKAIPNGTYIDKNRANYVETGKISKLPTGKDTSERSISVSGNNLILSQ
jgi:hypothetical protein